MAGPSIDWNQYPTADPNTPPPYLPTNTAGTMTDANGSFAGGSYWNQQPGYSYIDPQPGAGGRTMDPSQAIPNTGINGGATTQPISPMPAVPLGTMTGSLNAPNSDPQALFNQLFPGDTLTPDMLTQNEATLNQHGITLVRNAAGVPGKIKLPNGQVVDVIQGAGSGLNKKQWLTGDTGGGAPGAGGILSGQFVSPIGQFTPPTAEDALNSPGLQFALSEANRMGQNNAAAKGTLLDGRFQQALAASNIQNALGGYNDVYNRAANTFGINYGVQTRNQDAPFSKYFQLAGLGQQAAAAS